MTERTCPICSSTFQPKRINSLTCSPACSKRARKLRERAKAFNEGRVGLTVETLSKIMRLLEADEVIAADTQRKAEVDAQRKAQINAAKAEREAQREVLDDEAEDPAEERRWRNSYAAELAMQRRWMADWREAKLRLIARGHRPLWATPRMIEEAYKHYPDGLPSAALNTP